MSELLLSAEELSVGYDGRAVLSGVSISAGSGQVISFLGPNGAGKSTVLRTLAGLQPPVSGKVKVLGRDIGDIPRGELSRLLAAVFTDKAVPALTTVYQAAAAGRLPYTGFLGRLSAEDRRCVENALEATGTDRIADRMISTLSDGERQKVMIAAALAQQPRIIILDEPTSHLDIKHKLETMDILKRLAAERNIACIMSLHDIDMALKFCHRVILVKEGKVVSCGIPEDTVPKGAVDRLYGIEKGSYSELLGSTEISGTKGRDVFAVCGNGSGINVFRVLSREGFSVCGGIVGTEDTDHHIGSVICSEIISEQPFEPVSDEVYSRGSEIMSECRFVVDCGFSVGTYNRRNIDLICRGAESGKKVFSLRTPDECSRLFGECARKIECIGSTSELVLRIKAFTSDQPTRVRV